MPSFSPHSSFLSFTIPHVLPSIPSFSLTPFTNPTPYPNALLAKCMNCHESPFAIKQTSFFFTKPIVVLILFIAIMLVLSCFEGVFHNILTVYATGYLRVNK